MKEQIERPLSGLTPGSVANKRVYNRPRWPQKKVQGLNK